MKEKRTVKRCANCKKLRFNNEFHRDKTSLDGRKRVCKECTHLQYKAGPIKRHTFKPKVGDSFRAFLVGTGKEHRSSPFICTGKSINTVETEECLLNFQDFYFESVPEEVV